MATSRLIPRHIDAGRSILATIAKSIDYGKNPGKTRDGKLISYHECDPRTAAVEFTLAKRQYVSITGREQPKDKDILLYQIRQAFPKGEVTPEEANRIAHELALRWTKGRHAFLVCTHEDKEHIHSHIYYNSTNLDCDGKFNNFLWSGIALRRLSDLICLEKGLSIVKNPKPGKGKHYGQWLGDLLRFKLPEMKRAARCNTLKGDYTEAAIRERIEGKRIVAPKAQEAVPPTSPKLNLLIDVQTSIKAKGSPGYERRAGRFSETQNTYTIISFSS